MSHNSNGNQSENFENRLFKVETRIDGYKWLIKSVIVIIIFVSSFIGYSQYNIKKELSELSKKSKLLKNEIDNYDKHVTEAISNLKNEEGKSIQNLQKATFERIKNINQPYSNFRIFSDFTKKGQTKWEKYETFRTVITLWVDTSQAGFSSTPIYLTALHGDGRHFEVVGIESIYEAKPDGFRLYLTLADNSELTPEIANKYNWTVNWVGLEPLPKN